MLDAIAAHIDFIHGNHIFGEIVADSIVAVSYTHLDVYKRQYHKVCF